MEIGDGSAVAEVRCGAEGDMGVLAAITVKPTVKVAVVGFGATLPAMELIVTTVLEIIKYTLPALVVYFTAKTLLTRQLQSEERRMAVDRAAIRTSETLGMRLQAYERLSVFCERIALHSLIQRLSEPEQTAGELKLSIYLSVQQEYEHNIAQQVYMSQALWDIIQQARDNTLRSVESVAHIVDDALPARELARALLDQASPTSNASLAMALAAIKREASTVYS